MNVKNEIFRRFFPAVTVFVLSLCFSAEAGILHIAPEGGLQLGQGDVWSLQNDGANEFFTLRLGSVRSFKQIGEVFTQEDVEAEAIYDGIGFFELQSNNDYAFLLDMNGAFSRLAIGDTLGDSSSYLKGRGGFDLWILGDNLQDNDQALRYSDGPFQNFDPGTEGYFGFRFDLDADGDANSEEWQYGWARVTFTGEAPFSFGADGPPPTGMTLHEWAYEETVGRSIQTGAIPEPSTLGMIGAAAFAMYLAQRRRNQKKRGVFS